MIFKLEANKNFQSKKIMVLSLIFCEFMILFAILSWYNLAIVLIALDCTGNQQKVV